MVWQSFIVIGNVINVSCCDVFNVEEKIDSAHTMDSVLGKGCRSLGFGNFGISSSGSTCI